MNRRGFFGGAFAFVAWVCGYDFGKAKAVAKESKRDNSEWYDLLLPEPFKSLKHKHASRSVFTFHSDERIDYSGYVRISLRWWDHPSRNLSIEELRAELSKPKVISLDQIGLPDDGKKYELTTEPGKYGFQIGGPCFGEDENLVLVEWQAEYKEKK